MAPMTRNQFLLSLATIFQAQRARQGAKKEGNAPLINSDIFGRYLTSCTSMQKALWKSIKQLSVFLEISMVILNVEVR